MNWTTLKKPRGSLPAALVPLDVAASCCSFARKGVVMLGPDAEVLACTVAAAAVVDRLELIPVDGLVAVLVDLPNHVLYL